MLKKPTTKSTGLLIRELLKERGSGYAWQLWHILRFERKVTKMRYTSFLSYFKTLERLGLVLRSKPPKVEPSVPLYRKKYLKSVPRVWYILNPRKVDSEEWLHPQRSLHPEIFRLTHRRKGRPAGSRNKPKT